MKKLMNRIKTVMLMMASGILLVTCLNSCKQDHLTINTTSTVNIYSYLQQDNQFSMFKQIVDKAGYASFLNTYGAYTLFLPTNDGVKAYLQASNQASIDNIDAETAKKLVAFSLVADTISTQFFTDGKLRTPTTLGQYLLTGAVNVGSVTKTVINKQANLIQGNIKVGNGLIHVVDNMLVPAANTLAGTIESNPKYSIFTAALKATGLYNMLDTAKYLTVIAVPDSVLNLDHIPDFATMKGRYSTLGDPTNHSDSLWVYVAYHIWNELSYVSDISIINAHQTVLGKPCPSVVDDQQNILINDLTVNGTHEIGSMVDRSQSDVSASNGVVHSVLTNYTFKVHPPTAVYFDVAAQPEIIKTPGLYRVLGKSLEFKDGTIAGIAITYQGSAGYSVTYNTDKNPTQAYFYNNDYITCGVRFRVGTNGQHSIEFVTPYLFEGKYKIWVDYAQESKQTQVIPTYFDNDPLPNTLNTADPLNPNETDDQALARGYKSYSDAPAGDLTKASGYSGHIGRLLGIKDITEGTHKIRFESTLDKNGAGVFRLDVIEFRPVDMDQVHPRLGHNGNLVP